MKSAGDVWRLGHRPALDGLRGIACLLVLLGHDSLIPVASGGIGVAIFFTLSGFLITALLVERFEATGRFDLVDFYSRRALRLLPAVVAFLFVMGVISAFLAPHVATGEGIMATLFYYANWLQAFGPPLGGLQHTWSLSVEEQFYLVWPLVLIVASRWGRRGMISAVVAGIALSFGWRVVLLWQGVPTGRVYFGSDTRADGLLVGCLLALVLLGRAETRARPHVASGLLVGGGALCAALIEAGWWAQYALMPLSIAVVTSAVILCVAQGAPGGWLTNSVLRYVGRRSYALYLWSLPIGSLVNALNPPHLTGALTSLAITFGVGELSWRFVEQPVQTWGRRRRRPSPANVTVVPARG